MERTINERIRKKKKMKKLLIILVILLASCTPDDECGTVTDWDTDGTEMFLWIDGHKHSVNAGTWYEYNIGDYVCIEY
jgi:hypothetical protein